MRVTALLGIGSGTHGECDLPMAYRYRWSRVPMLDGHQIAPSPKVMTFALYKSSRRLTRLCGQFVLLVPNPAELGNRIRSRDFKARSFRSDQSHAAAAIEP